MGGVIPGPDERNAEVVDVEGHWVLNWPEGQATVRITREVLEMIVADHNELRRPTA